MNSGNVCSRIREFNWASLWLEVISLPLTSFILFHCISMFLSNKSNINKALWLTYSFGILSNISKLAYEMFPGSITSAYQLGEVSLVLAVGLHETIAVYRFGIVSYQQIKFPDGLKYGVVALTVLLGLFRISVEFTPCTDNSLVSWGASFLFYGYLGVMDVVISSISLKIIYEIKKKIILEVEGRKGSIALNEQIQAKKESEYQKNKKDGVAKASANTLESVSPQRNSHTRKSKGIMLIQFVMWLMVGEIISATVGFLCMMLLDGRTAKAATDLAIFSCGFFALMYSKYMMEIVALKPSRKFQDRTLEKMSRI